MRYYFPELDYFFLKYWWYNKDIYSIDIPYPEIELNENIISPNCFFALLFNNTYMEYDYVYTFKEINTLNLSKNIRERLRSAMNHDIKFYVSSSTDLIDYFDIENEVGELLDILLDYRLTDTCDLSTIIYENLNKNLSKMIYQYLDLMINDNTVYFNEYVFGDSNNILEMMYESYLINEAHKKIKNLGYLLNGTTITTRPERFKTVLTSEDEENQYVVLTSAPVDNINFYVFKNGNLLDNNSYVLSENIDGDYIISWTGEDILFKEGDTLIADYYVIG